MKRSSLYVLDALGKVYHNDSLCKQLKLSPEERLAYHKNHSEPIMHKLKLWLNKQFDDHLVEPNSNLGRAINYMLNHWHKLTRFLYVAGAPLDNNLIERALKIPIRIRKNAMFFATTHGAFVGSMLLSIIITCVEAGENPVEYLTYLQKNKTALFKEPHKFLPWNYKDNILINHQGGSQ